jgi:superfamily II DNA helicase RecQ
LNRNAGYERDCLMTQNDTHAQTAVDVNARLQIKRIAQEAMGFESLRPGQQAVIRSVLDGHDTVAVMPTGSGKSAIYQIAGTLVHGVTVVVSPLIALQRDQAASIAEQEVVPGDAPSDLDQLAAEAALAQEQRREYEMSRLEMMRGYAEAVDCRRRHLLSYFGEELAEPCGYCDNCDAGTVASSGADRPFPVNSRVVHKKMGRGTGAEIRE